MSETSCARFGGLAAPTAVIPQNEQAFSNASERTSCDFPNQNFASLETPEVSQTRRNHNASLAPKPKTFHIFRYGKAEDSPSLFVRDKTTPQVDLLLRRPATTSVQTQVKVGVFRRSEDPLLRAATFRRLHLTPPPSHLSPSPYAIYSFEERNPVKSYVEEERGSRSTDYQNPFSPLYQDSEDSLVWDAEETYSPHAEGPRDGGRRPSRRVDEVALANDAFYASIRSVGDPWVGVPRAAKRRPMAHRVVKNLLTVTTRREAKEGIRALLTRESVSPIFKLLEPFNRSLLGSESMLQAVRAYLVYEGAQQSVPKPPPEVPPDRARALMVNAILGLKEKELDDLCLFLSPEAFAKTRDESNSLARSIACRTAVYAKLESMDDETSLQFWEHFKNAYPVDTPYPPPSLAAKLSGDFYADFDRKMESLYSGTETMMCILAFVMAPDVFNGVRHLAALVRHFKGVFDEDLLPWTMIEKALTMVSAVAVVPHAYGKASSAFGPVKAEEVVHEGADAMFKQAHTLYKMLRSSPLSIKLSTMFGALLGSMIFGESEIMKTSWINSLCTKAIAVSQAALQPLDAFFELAGHLTSHVERFQETRDIRDLFGYSKDAELMLKGETILALCEGVRMDQPLTCDLRKLCLDIEEFHRSALGSKSPLVFDVLRRLKDFQRRFRENLGGTRIKPLSIIISGLSGMGKSTWCSMLAEAYKSRYKIDKNVQVMHTWQTMAKHQVLPVVSKILLINDYFQTKEEYMEDNALELLQCIADTTPFRVNTASIEEKKDAALAPDFALVTTNSKEYVMSKAANGANKLDRRWLVAHFQLRPSLRQEGAKDLDVWRDRGHRPEDMQIILGKMSHKPADTTLKIAPTEVVAVFEDLRDFANWCLDTQAEMARDSQPEFEFCEKCLNLKTESCCKPIPVPRATNFFVKRRVDYEGLWSGVFTVRPDEDSMGRVVSAARRELAPLVESSIDRFWSPIKDAGERFKRIGFLLELSVGMIAFSYASKALISLWRASKSTSMFEGIVTSSPTFADQSPAYVSPYAATANAWVAKPALPVAEVWINGSRILYGAWVTNSMLVVPRHLFYDAATQKWRSPTAVTLKFFSREAVVEYEPSQVYLHPGKLPFSDAWADTAFWGIPHMSGVSGNLWGQIPEKPTTPVTPCKYGLDGPTIKVSEPFVYSVESRSGDCGALIHSDGVVYGMHSGRAGDIRVGTFISRSMAREAEKELGRRGFHVSPFTTEGMTIPPLLPGVHKRSDAYWLAKEETLENMGHVPLGHVVMRDASTMSGRPSVLHHVYGPPLGPDMVPPHTGKALEVDGEWKSAVTVRMRSTGKRLGAIQHQPMMETIDEYVSRFPVPERPLEPLSDHQSLIGSPLSVLINGRDTSKSVGPTLRLKGLTKEQVFSSTGQEGEYALHAEAVRQVASIWENVSGDGPIRRSLVQGVQKDELVDVSKFWKCRYFYVSDWAVNHVLRCLMLPIMQELMAAPYLSGIVVTVNAGSTQWKALGKHLTSHGDRIIDGDQKAYDNHHAAINTYYIECILRLAERFGYTPKHRHMLRRILLMVSHYVLILEGNWYICDDRLVSGRSDTIVMNSLSTVLMVRYFHHLLEPRIPPDHHIRIASTGDDLVIGRHEDSKLSGPEVAKGFGLVGYEFTAADKTLDFSDKRLGEIQYLKRSWTKDFKGALLLSSIYKSLGYCTGVSLAREAERNEQTAFMACREFYLHGREVFDLEMKRLSTHLPADYPSYDELDELFERGALLTWVAGIPVGIQLPTTPQLREDKYSGKLLCIDHDTSCPDVSKPAELLLDVYESAPERGSTHFISLATNINTNILPASHDDGTNINASSVATPDATPQPIVSVVTQDETVVSATSGKLLDRDEEDQARINNFFARPRVIWTPPVDSTASTIEAFSTYRALTAVDAYSSSWALFRGDLRLKIVYTGSPQLMGKYRLFAYPHWIRTGVYTQQIALPPADLRFTHSYTSQLPHIDIDLSTSKTMELELPWPHPNSFMLNQASSTDWRLYFLPVNAVRMANGLTPPAFNLQVLAYYENVELQVVQPEGLELPPNVLSKGLEYASLLSASIGHPAATLFSRVSGLASQVALSLGYTRPPAEPEAASVMRTQTNTAFASGQPSFAYGLGLDPGVSRLQERSIIPMARDDDTDLYVQMRRWAMIMEDIDLLSEYPMIPTVADFSPFGIGTTPLGWFSGAFEYYTGSIDICVEVVSSPLVRWRLGVIIAPPGVPPPPTFDTSSGQYISHLIEVVGSTCYEFTVPYLHEQNFRAIIPYTSFGNYLPFETRLTFYSLMDPIGPSATPVVPEINVWIRAGESFSVAVPNLQMINGYEHDMVYEGKDVGVENFGEYVGDLKYLASRPSLGLSLTGAEFQDLVLMPIDPLPPPANAVTPDVSVVATSYWTFLSWASAPFMGHFGGTNIYVHGVRESPSFAGRVKAHLFTTVPKSGADTSLAGFYSRGGVVEDYHNQTLGEVSVPDRNPIRFKMPFPNWTAALGIERLGFLNGGKYTKVDVLYSARDDFVMGGFLATPLIDERV